MQAGVLLCPCPLSAARRAMTCAPDHGQAASTVKPPRPVQRGVSVDPGSLSRSGCAAVKPPRPVQRGVSVDLGSEVALAVTLHVSRRSHTRVRTPGNESFWPCVVYFNRCEPRRHLNAIASAGPRLCSYKSPCQRRMALRNIPMDAEKLSGVMGWCKKSHDRARVSVLDENRR